MFSLKRKANSCVAAQHTVGKGLGVTVKSGDLEKGVSVRTDAPPPDHLVLHIWRVRLWGWRQRVQLRSFQLVAQGEAVIRYCCREELQSHVWFGLFAEMHKKELKATAHSLTAACSGLNVYTVKKPGIHHNPPFIPAANP